MRRSRIIALVVLAWSVSAFTQDRPNPFGFKPGWSRDQTISAVGKSHVLRDHQTVIIFDTSPGPSNNFDRFVVYISSKGLAKVAAVLDVPTNRSGEQVREKYDAIKLALVSKYGTPGHDYDLLHTGALYAEPEDFAMSLVKEERTLMTAWSAGGGTSILLEASGVSPQLAKIYLNYEFHPEFDAYAADEKKTEESAY